MAALALFNSVQAYSTLHTQLVTFDGPAETLCKRTGPRPCRGRASLAAALALAFGPTVGSTRARRPCYDL